MPFQNPGLYPYPLQKTKLADGSELAFMDTGKGRHTVLFVHGLSANMLSWHHNLTSLAESFRCIAVDLPGNGHSPDYTDGLIRLSRFARSLLHFIGQQGLQNVIVVGHSMGAQVALHMALEAPGALEKLVLVAPAGLETFNVWERAAAQNSFLWMDLMQPPEQTLAQFYDMAFSRLPREGRKLLQWGVQDARRHGDSRYRKMLMGCVMAMFQEPVHALLPQVALPVHILFGQDDALIPNRLLHPRLSPERLAAGACRRLPRGSYEIIPRAGHFLQWEAAHEVNRSIRQFATAGQPV